MKRSAFLTAMCLTFAFAACGGGEPEEGQEAMPGAQEPAPSGEAAPGAAGGGALTTPDWFDYDEAANTVTLEIVAGSTTDNNSWNFNGYFGGAGEIVVPSGAEVTIDFTNEDQQMAHSIGVDDRLGNFPANFTDPEPIFEGGMSSNPTSLTESTLPGESETITFTASEPGEYSLVCYVPGHAAVGMYVLFTVSDEGEAGVRE